MQVDSFVFFPRGDVAHHDECVLAFVRFHRAEQDLRGKFTAVLPPGQKFAVARAAQRREKMLRHQ
jgi:hypothetical protein